MTTRDKIGLSILIALFVAFFVTLGYTFKTWGKPRPVERSVIIEQRVINLNK
ncbi:MAG: hypothetical protein JXR94_04070 [Candidatus Hydrogenedentes bacterium]|nr:hypothetical protein [Candidatus Hydrogenedentota bacterium]